MHKPKLFTVLMTLMVFSVVLSSFGALSGTLIGTKQINDWDYTPVQKYWSNNELGTPEEGYMDAGRVHFYFRNDEASAVTITNLMINGTNFYDTPYCPVHEGNQYEQDSKWYMAWPQTVQPGEVCAVWMRICDIPSIIGSGSATFTVQCESDAFTLNFDPATSPMTIPVINIETNLTDIIVYMGNTGASDITLKSWGGLEINGVAVTGSLPTTTLSPGKVVPMSYTLDTPLTFASQAVYKVTANDGTTTAIGHMRTFPSRFDVTYWYQGSKWDETDAVLHNANINVPGQDHIRDEPAADGPATQFIDEVYALWSNPTNSTQPLMSQQTGLYEGSVFNGIWDVTMSHRDDEDFFYAYHNAWPQPNWFVPFNAWAIAEEANFNDGNWAERWPSLEGTFLTSARAIGWGAKQIQWFMYMSLWDQGYEGKSSAPDYARQFQDRYQVGAVDNPLLWKRLARANAVAQTVRPYLNHSCHYNRSEKQGDFEVSTVLSGTNRAVVAITDDRTPPSYPEFLDGYIRYGIQALYDQTVQVKVPSFTQKEKAYLVHPFSGVIEIPMTVIDSETVELDVDEIIGGVIVVIGDSTDGTALEAAWAQTHKYDVDNLVAQSYMRGANDGDGWYYTNLNFRTVVRVTNTTGSSQTLLGLPVDLPKDLMLSSNSLRVVEINGTLTNEVQFFAEPSKKYRDFSSSSVLSTFTYDNSNATSSWQNGEVILTAPLIGNASGNPEFKFMDGASIDWISAEYNCAIIEVNIQDFPAIQQQQWVMQWDYDGDGTQDAGHTVYNSQILDHGRAGSVESLSNGWTRFYIYPKEFCKAIKGVDLQPTGQWRIKIIDAFSITSGTPLDGQWKMRRYDLSGLQRIRVKPSGFGILDGQARTYHVYYDDPANTELSPSSQFNASLSGTYPTNMPMVNLGTEKGGGTVTASVGSDSVSVVTDVDVAEILLRHIDSDGLIVSETTVSASSAQNFSATLSRNMAAGDKLVIVPIQDSGLGTAFVYNDDGSSYATEEETDQHAVQVWSAAVTDLRPFSMDMTADGSLVAVTYQTNMVVYTDSGSTAWTTNYNQRLGFADFTEDDQYVYIAANATTNKGWTKANMYDNSDWNIIKANANTGAEIWRHQVGSGVVTNTLAGRTVFDLQVTPDGGVIYGEWNGYAVKLSSAGSVVWSNKAAGNYAQGIRLINETNAVVLSDRCTLVSDSGDTIGTPYLPDGGMGFALGASRNGSTFAYAGESLRIVTNGTLSATVYLGRVPRVIAVSTNGDLVAAGTMDGTVALLRKNGDIIWTNYNPASIVADLDFTPDGSGLIVTREVFTYNHDRSSPWMMHDLVEAYNLSGTKYWQDAGPDHTQSFMNQTDISDAGTEIAVFSGNEIRYATNNVPVLFPTITPFGGPFIGTQEVVLACATPSATIYYTTDGSAPTNTSSVYSSPISVTADTTIRAVAVLSGDWSVETMAEFDEQAAAPTFDPVPGTFGVSVTVSVSTVTGGADLYYTIDGSEPTTNSTEYTTPLVFTKDTTLKSIAVKDGVSSAVSAGAYSITNRVLIPGIGPDQNTQNYYVDVFITCSTPGASIYYTTNGAAPSTNTLLYSAPFRLWTNAQVRAIAVKDGLNNSLQAAKTYSIIRKVRTPEFSPAAGMFTNSVNVTLSTDPSDATLYYTTDGTDPNTGSSVYGAPINLTDSATVKVYGVRSTFTDSDIATAVYTKADLTPPVPGVPYVADLYGVSLRLAWPAATDNSGTIDRYEILRDGVVIATNTALDLDYCDYDLAITTEYSYAVTAYDASGNSATSTSVSVMTLYNLMRNPSFEWDQDANAFPDQWGNPHAEISWGTTNHTGSRSWRVDFSTAFADQYKNQGILLQSDTEYKISYWVKGDNAQGQGAMLRYIELDDDFHIRSTAFNLGTDTWQKVEATFTTQTNLTNGRVDLLWAGTNGTLWIDDVYLGYPEGDTAATSDPVLAPAGGSYGSSITVTMTCAIAGADIYYTTDGSDPTTNDTLYVAPFDVSASTTLKALAVRFGLDDSGITTETYAIDTTPPTEPGSYHVTMTNGRSVYLAWDASTDAGGVAGYRVLRDGTVLGTTTNLTYVDTTTAITSSYTYGVAAYDNSGLYSTTSEVAVTTTANLLQNPSMEEGSPWPTSWGRQDLTKASNDTIVAYEAGKSFAAKGLVSGDYYCNQNFTLPYSGVEYKLSCWIKTENVSGGNGIFVRWVRGDGTGNLIEGTSWGTGNQDWTYVEKTFTINSDVTWGRVDIVWDFTNGIGYVDKLYIGTTNAPANPDMDGDGMDDSWENANFGNTTTASSNTDYDADGFLDYAEFVAGTSPTDDTSFLQAMGDQSDVVLDDFVIQWTSASDKAYSLEYSTNLVDYFVVQTNIQSVAPANNSWTVDIQSVERSYYRIKIDE